MVDEKENEVVENSTEDNVESSPVEVESKTETSPVEVEEKPKTKKAKAKKKATAKKKTTKKKVTKKKGPSAGEKWWEENGQTLLRKGHSQRNIVLKAARAAGKTFDQAMEVLGARGISTEERIKRLLG